MKLRANAPLLSAVLGRVTASLAAELPGYGREIAIDATDMPGYSNGQSYTSGGPRTKPFSDPDAAWGFRSAVSTCAVAIADNARRSGYGVTLAARPARATVSPESRASIGGASAFLTVRDA